MHWEQQGQFCVEYEEDGTIRSLKNGTDSYAMNWVEGERLWGTVTAPLEITVERVHSWEDTELEERYRFTNQASYPVYIQKGDLGIYLTFNDNYQEAGECLTRRCHTHIWCGGSASYVMALRMGGEGRHLGLRLTEGSFIDYSVERDLEKRSNDRGDFIMHPGISCLQPGETAEVAWHLFWFDDAADFTENLKSSREFPVIESPHFTWFAGEEAVGTVTISGSAVPVFCDGNRLECRWEQQMEENIGHFSFPITEERDYRISLDTGRGRHGRCFMGRSPWIGWSDGGVGSWRKSSRRIAANCRARILFMTTRKRLGTILMNLITMPAGSVWPWDALWRSGCRIMGMRFLWIVWMRMRRSSCGKSTVRRPEMYAMTCTMT